MGVKGLLNLLTKFTDLHQLFLETTPAGATLVVDGNNFMFYLLGLCEEGKSQPLDRRYGGSYESFRKIITREFSYLQQLGFEIEVYFDGHASSFKDFVLNDKKNTIDASWIDFYVKILYRHKVLDQSTLPPPPLSRISFEWNLKQHFPSIKVIQEEGEADIAIGFRCQELQGMGKAAFVYSDDSDFFAMKGCRVIKFETFSLHHMHLNSNLKSVHCRNPAREYCIEVWSRLKLASALGLTEKQFVDFCIFLGSDFTKGFSRLDYRFAVENVPLLTPPEVVQGGGGRVVSRILDYFRSCVAQYRDFHLVAASKDTLLQQAIDYSRRFYQLEITAADLEQAPRLDDEASGSDDDDEEEDNTLSESAASAMDDIDESEDDEWELSHNRCRLNEASVNDMKRRFCDFLVESGGDVAPTVLPFKLIHFMKNCLVEEVADNGLFEKIHVVSIENMIRDLSDPNQSASDRFFILDPLWDDILVAKLYQELLACGWKTLSRIASQHSSVDFLLSEVAFPCHFFYDGYLFHKHVYEQRKEEVFNPDLNNETVEDEREEEMAYADEVHNQLRDQLSLHSVAIEDDEQKGDVLPVERRKDDILSRLRKDHFLIVRGETGCGKSTRIPVMILEDAEQRQEHCRILVCEPHRAACQGLYNRVRSLCPDYKIALRLGMNVREGSRRAQITFATSGYVFHRYINSQRDSNDLSAEFTHIIIDEVHERSVENDLVCFIVKRLFQQVTSSLKVVLMSATVDSSIFYNYFLHAESVAPDSEQVMNPQIPSVDQKISNESLEASLDPYSLWVGMHPFDSKIHYIEDFGNPHPDYDELNFSLRSLYHEQFFLHCRDILELSTNQESVSSTLLKKQLELAKELITASKCGTSVLVFVAGMADITYFESELKTSDKYKVFPIHSDLDREAEERALRSLTPREKRSIVRVVVTTNAAESSITIPDLDIVIDLGTINRDIHDSSNFARTTLSTTWITKSSAAQRAGRTGRTGPGTVFRLYGKDRFHAFPTAMEPEIVKKPLHDVILRVIGGLPGIFDKKEGHQVTLTSSQTVADVLLELIDPPICSDHDDKLFASIRYLSSQYMLTIPNFPAHISEDAAKTWTTCPVCRLTPLGRFASLMPLSSHFSRVVVYALLLDLGGYGIILAAILSHRSLSRPFRFKRAEYTDPDNFNDVIRNIFFSMLELDNDNEYYSEPLLMMLLYLRWKQSPLKTARLLLVEEKKMIKLDKILSVYVDRLNAFFRTIEAGHLELEMEQISRLSYQLTDEQVTLLRLILVWIADGNIMRTIPPPAPEVLTQRDMFRNSLLFHGDPMPTMAKVEYLLAQPSSQASLSATSAERCCGKVVMVNEEKGFCFIAPESPQAHSDARLLGQYERLDNIYGHFSDITGPACRRRLRYGDKVDFVKTLSAKDPGKFCAKQITVRQSESSQDFLKIAVQIHNVARVVSQVQMKSVQDMKLSVRGSTQILRLSFLEFQQRLLLHRDLADKHSVVWSWLSLPQEYAVTPEMRSWLVIAVKASSQQTVADINRLIIEPLISPEGAENQEAGGSAVFSFSELHLLLGLQETQLDPSICFIAVKNPPFSGHYIVSQLFLLFACGIELFLSDPTIGNPDSSFTFRSYDCPRAAQILNEAINFQVLIKASRETDHFIRIQFPPKATNESSRNRLKFFTDLHTGQRLLNAYCAFRRGRCLVVDNLDYRAVEGVPRSEWFKTSTPRPTNFRSYTARWQLLHASHLIKDTSQRIVDNKATDGISPSLLDREEWSHATIDYYSYLNYSYPQRKDQFGESVYAVANAVLISHRGSGQTHVNCDQVTFLPYDQSGLLCIVAAVSPQWAPYVQETKESSARLSIISSIRHMIETWTNPSSDSQALFQPQASFKEQALRLHRFVLGLPEPVTCFGSGFPEQREPYNPYRRHNDDYGHRYYQDRNHRYGSGRAEGRRSRGETVRAHRSNRPLNTTSNPTPPAAADRYLPPSRTSGNPTATDRYFPPSRTSSNPTPPAATDRYFPPSRTSSNPTPPAAADRYLPPSRTSSNPTPPAATDRYLPPSITSTAPAAADRYIPPSRTSSNPTAPAATDRYLPPSRTSSNPTPPAATDRYFPPSRTSSNPTAPAATDRYFPPSRTSSNPTAPAATDRYLPPSRTSSNPTPPAATDRYLPPSITSGNPTPPAAADRYFPPSRTSSNPTAPAATDRYIPPSRTSRDRNFRAQADSDSANGGKHI